jgi:hypothetical protein
MSNLSMPLLSVATHGTASAMAPKDIHGKPTVDTELHCRLGSRTRIHFISLRLIVSR